MKPGIIKIPRTASTTDSILLSSGITLIRIGQTIADKYMASSLVLNTFSKSSLLVKNSI